MQRHVPAELVGGQSHLHRRLAGVEDGDVLGQEVPLHVSEHHFVLIGCQVIENGVTIILLDGECLAEVVVLQGLVV